jgi:hypothetical protein
MRTLVILLPALALSAAAARAQPGEIEIRADVLEAVVEDRDGRRARLVGEGNVVVESEGLLLRAPRLDYDRATGRASLSGGVVGVDGLLVLSADRLEADLANRSLSLSNGRVLVKAGITAPALRLRAGGDDPAQAVAAGRDALTVRASRILREGDGPALVAEDVWLSTCDCGADCRPFLSLSAETVRFVPGETARLGWWRFLLFDVPVMPKVPSLTYPLGGRASGLLMPRGGFTGPGGFGVDVPVFLTLGDSADVTLHGRWFRGTGQADLGGQGVRGFGSGLELRWRPAVDASGGLAIAHLHDTSRAAGGGIRGNRGRASLAHAQGLGGGRLFVDATALSDSTFLFDSEPTLQVQQLPYLRSVAGYTRPIPGGAAFLSTTHLQQLSTTRQRALEAPLALSPVAQAGLFQQFQAGPLVADAFATFSFEDALVGSTLAPGRTRRLVGGLALGQTLPLASGRYGQVALEAGERLDLLAPEGGPGRVRAGLWGGLAAGSRLSRTFEGGWVHEIAPSIRLRGFGVTEGFAPALQDARAAAPQDVTDAALPSRPGAQLVSRLATSLATERGRPAELWVEHHGSAVRETGGVGLDAGQLHFGGRFEAPLALRPRLSMSGVRDLVLGRFVQGSASLAATAAGTSASLFATSFQEAESDLLTRGLDVLFTPREALPVARAERRLILGGSLDARLGRLRLQGSALSTELETAAGVRRARQLSGGFAWDAGGCATLSATARWLPDAVGAPVQLSVAFELGDVTTAVGAAAASVRAP